MQINGICDFSAASIEDPAAYKERWLYPANRFLFIGIAQYSNIRETLMY